ncbi:hypothetical protein EMPS_00733 [Entomortierella parvispora]|uniref:Enoyl reductase (ER) domain-containing protein n=1 Tax=Entomortierella parvispora TaxID=205924 RepID=A0A9P3H293_9FUNG|nr:hypothetical protein EMPS_00733 [Entomortierella parvispora]
MMSTFKPSEDHSVTFTGWASTGTPNLKPWGYHPRPLGPKDVEIEISHCGICGTDIHCITGAFGALPEPEIVGHEIVGKIVAAGAEFQNRIGEHVGVGAVVDACGDCKDCTARNEQLCSKKSFIFNDTFKDGHGGKTYGGFADRVRVHGDFVYKIPENISLAEAAPLLCAGVTTFAPLIQHQAGPGKSIGVIGIGGLGHMAIQWAAAMKCDEVVAISSSDSKREESKKLGATKFIDSKNPEDMKAAAQSMDIILCTSFAKDADWAALLNLVANNGKMVLLGLPEAPLSIEAGAFVFRQVSMVGSLIGGKKMTGDMLDFAAKHNIRPWIETMPMSDCNAAVKHVMEGRPRYRVVMETGAAVRA